ncbi:hypothetical protein DFH06DRAFT_1123968 [Mycena polygramma]|nr:hypothetical protein DFH06DRAFT_1123968 [Mycena polygramma]
MWFSVTEGSDIICLMDNPSIEECLQPTYAIMIIMRELDGFTFDQEGTYSSPAVHAGHSYHRERRVGIASTDSLDTYIIPTEGNGSLKDIPDYSKIIFAQASRTLLTFSACVLPETSGVERKLVKTLPSDSSPGHLPFGLTFGASQRPRDSRVIPGGRPRTFLAWTRSPSLWVLHILKAQRLTAKASALLGLKSSTLDTRDPCVEHPRPSLAQLMRACNQESQDMGSEPDCTPWYPQLLSLALLVKLDFPSPIFASPQNMRAPLAL